MNGRGDSVVRFLSEHSVILLLLHGKGPVAMSCQRVNGWLAYWALISAFQYNVGFRQELRLSFLIELVFEPIAWL
jgi:hypothetical protein